MEKKNIDDITFKLLANPIRFRKDKNDIPTDDDDLFLKINKKYPDMFILNSDKGYILEKIESLLTEITITNIINNLIKELEDGFSL